MDEDLRLAELLAALSVATDLGMGHEPEKAVRSCLLATELARASGLSEVEVRDVYYTSMLIHLGCTAPAPDLTYLFGDDHLVGQVESTDEQSLRGSLELLALVGRGTGLRRAQHLGRVLSAGKEASTAMLRSVCEVGSRMAERLRLGEGVQAALGHSTETWDGRSGAYGRQGDDIPLAGRFALLSTQVVIFDRLGGPDAAVEVVQRRAGRWFDPTLADVFVRQGTGILERMADIDVWEEVLEAEPAPVKWVPPSQVDEIARVFGDMVDLKSTFTLGRSAAVAELAVAAAQQLGFADDRIALIRRAGLLQDLGRVAVSGAVWEKPGPLTLSQWEQVRLHPYHTERILCRSSTLTEVGRIAGMHHERSDGSGYHHGVGGAAIPAEAGLLAVADAFQAMTQDRPHRPAMAADEAAKQVEKEAAAGTFDVECARAVIEASGHRPVRRGSSWPAGLTDREVDALRLLARGATNREIAADLVISPRTAEHHVQHIYTKIGGSTRAAAALFAMEHGLVR